MKWPHIIAITALLFIGTQILAESPEYQLPLENSEYIAFVQQFFVDESLLLPCCISIGCEDTDHQMVSHTGYTLCYRESYEQAEWVFYVLTANEVRGNEPRSGKFREDPAVLTDSASPSDYAKSGYDRGHLAPAADMKWSTDAMEESFYMSNMSPQKPRFNRGIWNRLEQTVRDWALCYGSVAVVTGPILNMKCTETIGENNVVIPLSFYKVLLAIAPDKSFRCVAYILPNTSSSALLTDFVVTVDDLEDCTGIDFFSVLPDLLENMLESSIHSEWLIP